VTCVADCSKKHAASFFRIQMAVRFVSLKQKSLRNVVTTAHVHMVSTTKNRINNDAVSTRSMRNKIYSVRHSSSSIGTATLVGFGLLNYL